jgi:hypothetical protein
MNPLISTLYLLYLFQDYRWLGKNPQMSSETITTIFLKCTLLVIKIHQRRPQHFQHVKKGNGTIKITFGCMYTICFVTIQSNYIFCENMFEMITPRILKDGSMCQLICKRSAFKLRENRIP